MLESQLPYRVVVHNDEEHSYEYVIQAFMAELKLPRRGAIELAQEVDEQGRVKIPVADLPAAQALQERLYSYGPDKQLPRSRASLMVSVEEHVGGAIKRLSLGRVSPDKGFERLEPADVLRLQKDGSAGTPRMLRCGRLPCGTNVEMAAPPIWFVTLFGLVAIVIFAGSMIALAFATHR